MEAKRNWIRDAFRSQLSDTDVLINNGKLTNVQSREVQLHVITVNLQNHKTNKKNNTVLDEKGLGKIPGVCNSQKEETPLF